MISLEPISGSVHNHADGLDWLDFLEQNKTLTASKEKRKGGEMRRGEERKQDKKEAIKRNKPNKTERRRWSRQGARAGVNSREMKGKIKI